LGAFFAFLFLTQIKKDPDKRKKKKKFDWISYFDKHYKLV
jgi:hypothetical protein